MGQLLNLSISSDITFELKSHGSLRLTKLGNQLESMALLLPDSHKGAQETVVWSG